MDGAQIRRQRERRGLTQEQLAQAIGVGPRTIGNWERGAVAPLNKMGAIEAFFGVAQDDESADPLRAASEVALIAELMRRATERAAKAS